MVAPGNKKHTHIYNMKTALIIGATGMVGSSLLLKLVASDDYNRVVAFVRKSTGISHSKLTEFVVNFDDITEWATHIQGDVLFSCMGTTLRDAGSKSEQFRVDFEYQYNVARAAAGNGVKQYLLVSSAGASAGSANFYLATKGKLDDAVRQLTFEQCVVLRPGQLYGNRQHKRPAENYALRLMFLANRAGLFQKYRPIHAGEVADALISAAQKHLSGTFSLNELFTL